jgi:UDP-N-acetylmuramoyl-tripeptide--D-alanyl-D-alanine ligase
MNFNLRECFDRLDQAVLMQGSQAVITLPIGGVSTDTRTLKSGQLFVALRGDQFDGNTKVNQALEAGACGALMDDAQLAREAMSAHPKVAILLVKNARLSLAQLALAWRVQFTLPVIAVTGSNGKTTVKEMIAAILRQAVGEAATLATAGNLNGDIGVPLTLFGLSASKQLAVVELGMNHPGEIAHLAKTTLPTVALVNNAQREHQEFMHSVQAVAQENGSVLQGLGADGTAVFPANNPYSPLWAQMAGKSKIMTFGWTVNGTLAASEQPSVHAHPEARNAEFILHSGTEQYTIRLNIAGRHNVLNALAAATCARAVGIDWQTIVNGLASFKPVAGRLAVHQICSNNTEHTLVDDSYNANPDSVLAAIQVLSQMPHPQWLVLGDMGEVGNQGEQFHTEIGLAAATEKIDRLYTLGDMTQASSHAYQGAGGRAQHFTQIDGEQGLLAAIDTDLRESTVAQAILVKGSRFMRMERVVQHLAGGHR